jgi:hypothetical protein
MLANKCTNSTISGCEVLLSENHNYGIWLVMSQDIQVLDNRIDGFSPTAGQEGIESWSSDDVIISGNAVENIGGAGINLGSVPTPRYGDIAGTNSNITVLDNTVTNAYVGVSVGLAGPRTLDHVDIKDNLITNVAFGVRLLVLDKMDGGQQSESATVNDPQYLKNVNIENNRINLVPQSGNAIFLDNTAPPNVAFFESINASGNIISNAPGDLYDINNVDNFSLDDNIVTGSSQTLRGSQYEDIIVGSNLANLFTGGGGADTFVFDLSSLAAGNVDRVLDYNQGNSGTFNSAEDDILDLSALVSSAAGQPIGNFVRVLDDLYGRGTYLQVDRDGLSGGSYWTTIAILDKVQEGSAVKVVVNNSQPATSLAVMAGSWQGAWTADFNGDGKSDILGHNDTGLATISIMNGSNVVSTSALPNIGLSWHIAAAADFSGDGKADLLWQNDSGLTGLWTMNGGAIAANSYLPNIGPTWQVAAAADFNGDGKSDVVWQNDNGTFGLWTMNGATITGNAYLPSVPLGWHVMATADFNGDGKADLLWQDANNQAHIWTMNGVQRTGTFDLPGVGANWHVIAAADFNGDRKADILWQNETGLPGLWTMNGTTPSAYAYLLDPGAAWRISSAADFDGDGKADILLQDNSGASGLWTMNGSQVVAAASLPDVAGDWHLV